MGDETHRALTADSVKRTGLIRFAIRPNINGDRTTHPRLPNTLLATRTRLTIRRVRAPAVSLAVTGRAEILVEPCRSLAASGERQLPLGVA